MNQSDNTPGTSSKPPPIQFLPVFEAAARHLSFKKAAAELCVTAPAVGQQVKAFEHWLGEALFQRHTRSLSLTEVGEYYYQLAQTIVQTHRQGFIEYQRRFHNSSLHVSAPLFIAQELLMPNYLGFSDYSAGTELRIEARTRFVDFDSEAVDAAIRFGDGNWPNLHCQLLCPVSITPVCSPIYAEAHSFKELSDFSQHRLITESEEMAAWNGFFEVIPVANNQQRIVCDSYLASIKAASDGLGIALALLPTANDWINSGRLVTPFRFQYPTNKGYWLVTPKYNEHNPEIHALQQWLKPLFSAIAPLDKPLAEFKI